ncbi:hypothetical protein Cgig2_018483 [Carnegiea gigantea]|uniref:RRM domain-containing protein n=1 Tax=Carnegiea gigantea TaxID=171969 RepID=A0A9Q1JPN4_9CARY|nr:hypothetical protein Cgig2_018483 [Carnegiea gigantea]
MSSSSSGKLNAVFYADAYHPIQAGSIDGTDILPHDNAIYRAHLCSSAGLYDPFGDPKVIGDPYCTLFVGHLSHATTEDTLHQDMSRYGRVKNLRLVRDIVTGASRGYAFVEFETEREMRRAYEGELQRSVSPQNSLKVEEAREASTNSSTSAAPAYATKPRLAGDPHNAKGQKRGEKGGKNKQQISGEAPATGRFAADRSHSPATTESPGEPDHLSGEVQKPPLAHRTEKSTNIPSKSHQPATGEGAPGDSRRPKVHRTSGKPPMATPSTQPSPASSWVRDPLTEIERDWR